MAQLMGANINVLWQNLIALNSSLFNENEELKQELKLTKEQLQNVRTLVDSRK